MNNLAIVTKTFLSYNFFHMDDTKTMLRAIINGQSTFRQEVLSRMDKLDKKIDGVEERLNENIDGIEKKLSRRIDNLGKYLAYLEDDTPTKEEFDGLGKRVAKLEQKTPAIV